MDFNAIFGELRSLAHRPGEASWGAICAALEHVDEERAAGQLVPYLEGNLKRWPAHLREAPWAWVERALAGEAPAALRLAGSLSIVRRKNVYRQFRHLVNDPALANVRHLRIDGTPIWSTIGVRALAASPLAGQLEELHVAEIGMGDETLDELLASDFPNLTSLHLERNQLSQSGISALLDKPIVLGLEELHVDTNPIGANGAAMLASAAFTNLKVLSMGTTELGDLGIIELCDGVGFSKVERLELARCEIGPTGAAALEVAECFPSLRYLSIWSNPLGDVGASHIANIRNMPNISYMGLAQSEVRDDGVVALAAREGLTRLDLRLNDFGAPGCAALAQDPSSEDIEALFLSFTSIRDEGVEALFAQDSRLTNLRQLEMARCYLYSESLEAMARCPALDGLQELELSSNYVHDGMSTLVRSPNMSNLRMLGAEMCGLYDDQARELAESPFLERLVALYVGRNHFSAEGLRELARTERHPRLVALDLGDGELADELREELAKRYVDAPKRRVRCSQSSINYTLSVLADLDEADWDAFADAVLGVDDD